MYMGHTLTMPVRPKQAESKLYFAKGSVQIYNDDILKVQSVKDNSIDLMITSPPYNLDIKQRRISKSFITEEK